MTEVSGASVRTVDMPPLELGEGARWWPEGPVQVDLLAGRLLAHRAGEVETLLDLGVPLGAVAPRVGGGLVVVAGTGVRLLSSLADVSPVRVSTGADARVVRVNDATTDDQGRLWFGLTAYDGPPESGSLWRLDPDLTLTQVLVGLDIPNGPVVDAERGVLYLAHSARGVICRYALDRGSGRLGPAEAFAEVPEGSPDGMALDVDGDLWSAVWGAARLHRYRPDGSLAEVVPLPVEQPTSLALDPRGGPALVTSARLGVPSPSADDGRSLWVDLGATGRPPRPFG